MATKRKQSRGASGSGGRRKSAKRASGTRAAGARSASSRAKTKSSARRTSTKSGSGRSTAGRASGGQMDAIRLLKQDHREVERLVDEFERARAPKKAQLAEEICRQLAVHAQIEEEIFYPAAREALREEDLVDEAEVEHQSAKDLIAQIEQGGADDDMFEARVKVLGEYVKHHVREEEKEMFPQLQKRKLDLQALGAQMLRRKQQLLGTGESVSMDEEITPSARARGNGSRAPRDEGATMNAGASGGSRG